MNFIIVFDQLKTLLLQFVSRRNTFLYNNFNFKCIIPDIAYLIFISLFIVSVSGDCLDCEVNYHQCRSESLSLIKQKQIESSQMSMLQCECLEKFMTCSLHQTCRMENVIKDDFENLSCSFPLPKKVQKAMKSYVSPLAVLYVSMSLFIILTIVCVVALFVRYHKEISKKIQRIGNKIIILANKSEDCSDEECLINQEVSEEKLCKICYEEQRNAVFVPCGHLCSCFDCALKLNECPLCRQPLEKIVKTFPC